MWLSKLNYRENTNSTSANSWEIRGLDFNNLNLIVGKNATGKSRVVNIINNVAKLIKEPSFKFGHGEWHLEFNDSDNNLFIFETCIIQGKYTKEKIMLNGKLLLNRTSKKTELFSFTLNKIIKVQPPEDSLVLHGRRDKIEYPFFEKLVEWAQSVHGYIFHKAETNLVELPSESFNLIGLNSSPKALERLTSQSLRRVIKEFNSIGYSIEGAYTDTYKGLPAGAKILYIKEKGLEFAIPQISLSLGMFRAFAMLVIIEYLYSTKNKNLEKDRSVNNKKAKYNSPLILIDDFCEGLDFERSSKITKLIFNKMEEANIQLIVSSNDSFLMNVVDVKHWNILERIEGTVHTYNYANCKDVFNNFKLSGFNNFELLSSNFMSNHLAKQREQTSLNLKVLKKNKK